MSLSWSEIKSIMTDTYTKCCFEPIFLNIQNSSNSIQKEKNIFSTLKKLFQTPLNHKKLLICNLCKVIIHIDCRANEETFEEVVIECDIGNEKKDLIINIFSCNFCEVRNRAKILPKCLECGNPGGYMVFPYLTKKKNSLLHQICGFFSPDFISRPLKTLGSIQKPIVLKTYLKKNCFFCDLPIKRSLKCQFKGTCSMLAHYYCFLEERTRFICISVDKNSDQLWDFWYSFDIKEFDLPENIPTIENFQNSGEEKIKNNKFSKLISSIFVKKYWKTKDYFESEDIVKFDQFSAFFKRKLDLKVKCNVHSSGKRKNCYCGKILPDFVLCDCCGNWYHKECELEYYNVISYVCKKCVFFGELSFFAGFEEKEKIDEIVKNLFKFFKADKFSFHEFLFLCRFFENLLERCEYEVIKNCVFFFILLDQIKFENSYFGKFQIKKIISVIDPLLKNDFAIEYFELLTTFSIYPCHQDNRDFLSDFYTKFFDEINSLCEKNRENIQDFEEKSKLYLKTNYDTKIKKQIKKLMNLHSKLREQRIEFKISLHIIKEIKEILKNKEIDSLVEECFCFFETELTAIKTALDNFNSNTKILTNCFHNYLQNEIKNPFIIVVLKKLFDFQRLDTCKAISTRSENNSLGEFFALEKKILDNTKTDILHYKEFLKESKIILSFNFDNFLLLTAENKINFCVYNEIFDLGKISIFLDKFHDFEFKPIYKLIQNRFLYLSNDERFVNFRTYLSDLIVNYFSAFLANPENIPFTHQNLVLISHTYLIEDKNLFQSMKEYLNYVELQKEEILVETKKLFNQDKRDEKRWNQDDKSCMEIEPEPAQNQNLWNYPQNENTTVIEEKMEIESDCISQKEDPSNFQDKITQIETIVTKLGQIRIYIKELENWKVILTLIKKIILIELDQQKPKDLDQSKDFIFQDQILDLLKISFVEFDQFLSEKRKTQIKSILNNYLELKKTEQGNYQENLKRLKVLDILQNTASFKNLKTNLFMLEKLLLINPLKNIKKFLFDDISKQQAIPDIFNLSITLKNIQKQISTEDIQINDKIKILHDYCDLILIYKNIFLTSTPLVFVISNEDMDKTIEVIDKYIKHIGVCPNSRIITLFNCLKFYLENEILLRKEVPEKVPVILNKEFFESKQKSIRVVERRLMNNLIHLPFFKNHLKKFLEAKIEIINFNIMLKREIIKFASSIRNLSQKLVGFKIQEKELAYLNLKSRIISLDFSDDSIIGKFLYIQYMYLFLKIKTNKKITKDLLINYLELGMNCSYISNNITHLVDKINEILKIILKIENFHKEPISEDSLLSFKMLLNQIDESQIPQYSLNLTMMKNLKKTISLLKKSNKHFSLFKKNVQSIFDTKNNSLALTLNRSLEKKILQPFRTILQMKKLCNNYNSSNPYVRRFVFERIGHLNFFHIEGFKDIFTTYYNSNIIEPKISVLRKSVFEEFLKIISEFDLLSEISKISKTLNLFSKICIYLCKKKIKMKISCVFKLFEYIETLYFAVNKVFIEEKETKERDWNSAKAKKLFGILYFQLLKLILKAEEYFGNNKKNEFNLPNIIPIEDKIEPSEIICSSPEDYILKGLNVSINKNFFNIQKEFFVKNGSKTETLDDMKNVVVMIRLLIKEENEREILNDLIQALKIIDDLKYEKQKLDFLEIIKPVTVEKSIIFHDFDYDQIIELFSNTAKIENINLNQIKTAIFSNTSFDKEQYRSLVISFAKKFENFLANNKKINNLKLESMFRFFSEYNSMIVLIDGFIKGEISGSDVCDEIANWIKNDLLHKKNLILKNAETEQEELKRNKRFNLFDEDLEKNEEQREKKEAVVLNSSNSLDSLIDESLKKMKKEMLTEPIIKNKILTKNETKVLDFGEKNGLRLIYLSEKGEKLNEELFRVKIYTVFSESFLENFPNILYQPMLILKSDKIKNRKWSKRIIQSLSEKNNKCFSGFTFLKPKDVFLNSRKFNRFCFFGVSNDFEFYLFHFSHFLYSDINFFDVLQIKLIKNLFHEMKDINNLFIVIFIKKTNEKINPGCCLSYKNLKTENFEQFLKKPFLEKLNEYIDKYGWSKNRNKPRETKMLEERDFLTEHSNLANLRPAQNINSIPNSFNEATNQINKNTEINKRGTPTHRYNNNFLNHNPHQTYPQFHFNQSNFTLPINPNIQPNQIYDNIRMNTEFEVTNTPAQNTNIPLAQSITMVNNSSVNNNIVININYNNDMHKLPNNHQPSGIPNYLLPNYKMNFSNKPPPPPPKPQ